MPLPFTSGLPCGCSWRGRKKCKNSLGLSEVVQQGLGSWLFRMWVVGDCNFEDASFLWFCGTGQNGIIIVGVLSPQQRFQKLLPLAHFISIIVLLWLQDIWQLLHPTGKSYSYFSSIHHCHWRIDFSLLCSNLSQFILDCSMWNILISYHTAIQLTILF